jgi:hypothetical protein
MHAADCGNILFAGWADLHNGCSPKYRIIQRRVKFQSHGCKKSGDIGNGKSRNFAWHRVMLTK